jgi:hypothetical protein
MTNGTRARHPRPDRTAAEENGAMGLEVINGYEVERWFRAIAIPKPGSRNLTQVPVLKGFTSTKP